MTTIDPMTVVPPEPVRARPLTQGQREVLDFIIDYVKQHRVAPTLEEIAAARNTARVAAHETIGALEEKGWLIRHKHKSRGIELLGRCPCCGQGTPIETPLA